MMIDEKRPSERRKKFDALSEHAWFRRIYKRLNKGDLTIAYKFIDDHEELNKSDFDFKMNRFFLNQEKPKNWKYILELLMISNG